MYIYKITNQLNGKMYIGQTTRDINTRFQEHLKDASNGSTFHLHNAIRKYGPENFSVELVASTDSFEDLDKLEDYYIQLWNTIDCGYNMMRGGQKFGHANPMDCYKSKLKHDEKMRSDEVKTKISRSLKRYYQMNHDSPVEVEHRKKLSYNKNIYTHRLKGRLSKLNRGLRSSLHLNILMRLQNPNINLFIVEICKETLLILLLV